MTHDPARKLIEEAREILLQSPTFNFSPTTRASEKLAEALSLLPDADESASNWQEFDPEREETWPPSDGENMVMVTVRTPKGEVVVSQDYFLNGEWQNVEWQVKTNVLAWMPLPQPYVKT